MQVEQPTRYVCPVAAALDEARELLIQGHLGDELGAAVQRAVLAIKAGGVQSSGAEIARRVRVINTLFHNGQGFHQGWASLAAVSDRDLVVPSLVVRG